MSEPKIDPIRAALEAHGVSLEAPERDGPAEVILFGDFGRDLDDENALILAAALHRAGLLRLRAVIANLAPAKTRARLAKGTLRALGLGAIPVGVGEPCVAEDDAQAYESGVPYLADEAALEQGRALLRRCLEEAAPRSLRLVVHAGLSDVAWLLMDDRARFLEKVREVIVMGGVEREGEGALRRPDARGAPALSPDASANHAFDWPAALFLYQASQEQGVPLWLLSRHAVYACHLPKSLYERLAATGSPIGRALLERQQPALDQLWARANAPLGSALRDELPARCDRAWFVDTFCEGVDPPIFGEESVWAHVRRLHLYDPMAVLAAVPLLRARFYAPHIESIRGTRHAIVGLGPDRHGVADVAGLRSLLVELEVAALEVAARER